jgi:hypothetical protein
MPGDRGGTSQSDDLIQRARAFIGSAGVDFWYPVLVLLAIGILSGLGLSGSSIGALSASGKPDSQAIVAGTPRAIRSDEWLADSPMRTGIVRAGFPTGRTYGLGTPDVTGSWQPLLPARNLGAAWFSPFNLPLVLLPLNQGFALGWWLPFAACALGMYAWLRAMRISRGVALAASLITVYAPASQWWSFSMVLILALALIPCALLVAAARTWPRRPRLAVGTAILAGLAAAGLPWWYQPWALVAGIFVGGITVLWGLSEPERRRPFIFSALIAGAIFAGEELVYFLHERAYYDALTNTVYPGARRSDGGGVPLWRMFTSVVPFSLFGKTGSALNQQNLTEVSMGWTLALPLGLTVAALGRRGLRSDPERTLLIGTGLLGLLLTSWCVVAWPTILGQITFLDYIPPQRMAPFIGLFGTVLLALLFGQRERRERILRELGRSGTFITVGAMAFLTAWAATEFKVQALPPLPRTQLWLAVIVTIIVVGLLCSRWWAAALVLATALAVSSGILVNPLVKGTGALDNSTAARTVRQIDKTSVAPFHGTWAADDIFASGLLNGEGVNSLSSFNNPVDAQGWRKLDPQNTYQNQWNRYGYIVFSWDTNSPFLTVDNPAIDAVKVFINPCSRKLSAFNLRMVVASHPLTASCLVPAGHFRWMNIQFSVYRRVAALATS